MARMNEWPAWRRWGVWLTSWILYLGAFAALLALDDILVRGLALVVLCAGLLLLTYSSKAVLNERMRNVDRWQLRVMLPAFVFYIVLVLYVWPMQTRIGTQWLKIVVALLPLVPLIAMVGAMIRYVAHCDELERRQHLEAIGIAAAIVSLVSFTLGLLVACRLLVVNGALALLFVFPALCMMYGLTCAWSKWRNRAE